MTKKYESRPGETVNSTVNVDEKRQPTSLEPEPRQSRNPWRNLPRAVGSQNISLLVALVILIAIFGILEPSLFFLPSNLVNIGSAVALLMVLSLGQTVVILSGGLDISIGANAGVASVVAAWIMINIANNAVLGIVGAVVAGTIGGLINGLLITYGRVNPVIATLGTLSAYSGIGYVIADGKDIPVLNNDFNSIGLGAVLGVPYTLIIAILGVIVFAIAMRATDIGRNIYALGGNPAAARLAGIATTRYKVAIYAVSGLTAGVAGVILTARTLNGVPSAGGSGFELQAITAVVLGGAALVGGKGTIVSTVFGVLLLGVLQNGLTLLNVQTFYQQIATGTLLVVAVMIQQFRGNLPSWRKRAKV
jgi:ribose transport system permease protein/L-arabinose transport system permease protein